MLMGTIHFQPLIKMNFATSKPPCLGAGYRTSENIATFLAVAANVLLAWLVAKRSQKELRAFKRVLLLGCFVDSVFCITCNLFEIVSWLILGRSAKRGRAPFFYRKLGYGPYSVFRLLSHRVSFCADSRVRAKGFQTSN